MASLGDAREDAEEEEGEVADEVAVEVEGLGAVAAEADDAIMIAEGFWCRPGKGALSCLMASKRVDGIETL